MSTGANTRRPAGTVKKDAADAAEGRLYPAGDYGRPGVTRRFDNFSGQNAVTAISNSFVVIRSSPSLPHQKSRTICSSCFQQSTVFTFSKPVSYAGLLQNCIGRKTRLYRYVPFRDRAVPHVVVTFSMSDIVTAMVRELIPYFLLIFSHYANTGSFLSRRNNNALAFGAPFRLRISGAAYFTLSRYIGKDSR